MPYRPVSARADGLLSLLGIKNLGRNPDLLMESVQPVVDVEPWYLRSAAVAHSETFTAAFASENFQTEFLQASEQEWLYVHYASGRVFTGGGVAGPSGKFYVFRASPGVVAFETPYDPPVPVSGGEFSTTNIRDIWIPPSFGLMYSGEDMVVATSQARVGALVTRVLV